MYQPVGQDNELLVLVQRRVWHRAERRFLDGSRHGVERFGWLICFYGFQDVFSSLMVSVGRGSGCRTQGGRAPAKLLQDGD